MAPATSRTIPRRPAFSMIELVMVIAIIGIIAGIAVPRMSRASTTARENALISNLSLLQSAIDRYTTEHGGLSPGHDPGGSVNASGAVFAARLTGRSDDAGAEQSDGLFGPYLRTIPRNPFNGFRTIRIGGITAGAGTHGWRYDPASQTIASDHGTGGGGVGGGEIVDIEPLGDADVGAMDLGGGAKMLEID